MSDRNQLERLVLGSFLYFVRSGDTVDGATVSATTKPDTTPASNWPRLGEVTAVAFDKDVKKNEYTEIRPNGAPRKRVEEIVLADYLVATLDNSVDIILEMLFGVGVIATGSGVTPFANQDRKVTGWLKCQMRRSGQGTDLTLFDVWVEARLQDNSHEFKAGDPFRPKIRFQLLNADLDSLNFPG